MDHFRSCGGLKLLKMAEIDGFRKIIVQFTSNFLCIFIWIVYTNYSILLCWQKVTEIVISKHYLVK